MNLRLSTSVHKQMSFPKHINMDPFFRRKDKVVFVVGPTGTGKSRLAIDIATRIPAEVINCDKIQVYKGLDIVTNKVTEEECRGVPHHLLGVVDPNADYTSDDFRHHASDALKLICARDRLPIIAGGSNSFIEALVNEDPEFQSRYECCFLWVDVSLPVLHSFVSDRVDRMLKSGLIDEVKSIFDPTNFDYSRGIKRAIGVPELDQYFRNETSRTRARFLESAIAKIKENTCMLSCRQLQKIHRLRNRWSWNMHRIDATEVFVRNGEEAEEAWERVVARPGNMMIEQFLYDENDHMTTIVPSESVTVMATNGMPISIPAMAAAAR
ncbi:adenylate isopentenyltransferase 5, chloroplastic [Mercurialis annua]|uniref:adenylate isopentenyltransferase 5, chloroplastic n=1 Tax=Mercurialis annua TaxID=3986 RepID=UPI0021609A33|nr:adenylate isopentenyltransferase 5, chloroplastic [Mercurialis annua]